MQNFLNVLPTAVSKHLSGINAEKLTEIRLRSNRNIILCYTDHFEIIENSRLCAKAMQDIFTQLCSGSVYAYMNEISNGFITLDGGHRAGICGNAITENGKISNITQISGINIRFAKEFKGCSSQLLPYICKDKSVKNTLIISPPSCGKTTLLRDIARQLGKKYKISIIDERYEIAAAVNGSYGFDVGLQTDVLSGAAKPEGMLCALRSLSPEIIITDEIGARDDYCAINSVINAGVKIISSLHGYDTKSLSKEKTELLGLFELAIILSNKPKTGSVKQVIELC